MPTPSDSVVDSTRSQHSSCPPDDDRAHNSRRSRIEDDDEYRQDDAYDTSTMAVDDIMPAQSQGQTAVGSTEESQDVIAEIANKNMELDSELPSASEMSSPASVESKHDTGERPILTENYIAGTPSMSHEFSNVRLQPSSPSSFLRAGSQFRGTQQSERQVYEVQVDLKHVDMRESFLCGYLRIQGLTEDHPTLTTYFEGEIIGSRYSFLTQHESWGSTDKVDLQHWAKFQAFRPYAKQAKRGSFRIPNLAQRDNIFMRWKEHFLVPDHRVRTISGASFEGFYYICFNQIEGTVSGIYFHAKSEKFQQLELKHVEDRGCFSAMEFR